MNPQEEKKSVNIFSTREDDEGKRRHKRNRGVIMNESENGMKGRISRINRERMRDTSINYKKEAENHVSGNNNTNEEKREL